MFSKKFIVLSMLLWVALIAPVASAQKLSDKKLKSETRKPEKPKKPEKQEKIDPKNLSAEQIAETVVFYTGNRAGLKTVRRTEVESGKLTRFAADSATPPQDATYQKRIVRGETLVQDHIRLDQKLSQTEYALIYDATKTFGIINNSAFVPREEAANSFEAAIFHGLDALLRYKENGSTLKLLGKDAQMGVELYHLEVVDKQNRRTVYNISAKLYRVSSCEYEMATNANAKPTKFQRRFYDYRNAQGTLVPYRSVLYADGKQIEETNIATVVYGTKIADEQFQAE